LKLTALLKNFSDSFLELFIKKSRGIEREGTKKKRERKRKRVEKSIKKGRQQAINYIEKFAKKRKNL